MKPSTQASPGPPTALTEAGTSVLGITVLSGGPGDEREVSLASGRAIHDALGGRGHRVVLRDAGPDDLSALDMPADIVFVALHGPFGEDGTVQAIMEDRGINYCGSDAKSSALSMNKVAAKVRLLENDLPTPAFDVACPSRIHQVVSRWRTPVVVKPVASGSSVDVYIAHHGGALREAVERVVGRYGEALVEEFVEGPELTVGVLGETALPVCQIRTRREFYDYEAKYVDEGTEYLFDIDLPGPLLRRLQAMSLEAIKALGCRDFGRVDWMVDQLTHQPGILEVNTIPGFTSHSLLPKAAAAAGITFDALCQHIVDLGLKRQDVR
ncbi:MAG: D-alanine--D-alanine ligase [Phycisphaerales bacterium]|nr:MAG: D-alanine--D-alanine ligase [Phycisphaerales bacterium]